MTGERTSQAVPFLLRSQSAVIDGAAVRVQEID